MKYIARLVVTAFAVLLLASCGGNSGPSHACADKIAEAAVTQTVPGLWNCLSPDLQLKLHAMGLDGDGAIVKHPFALTYRYLGSTGDVAVYELTILPQLASQAGEKTVVVVVWVDSSGHVTNLGIPSTQY